MLRLLGDAGPGSHCRQRGPTAGGGDGLARGNGRGSTRSTGFRAMDSQPGGRAADTLLGLTDPVPNNGPKTATRSGAFLLEGERTHSAACGAAVVLAGCSVVQRGCEATTTPPFASQLGLASTRGCLCFCRAPPFRPFRAAEVSHGPESKTRGWRLSGSRSHAATRAFKIAADRLKLWSGGADKVDATGRQLLSWDGTLHNHVNACVQRQIKWTLFALWAF